MRALNNLPHDCLRVICCTAHGLATLRLAQCCHAFHAIALSDTIWILKLEEMGFTEAGIALWRTSGKSLAQAFSYLTLKHEPLEIAMLRDPIQKLRKRRNSKSLQEVAHEINSFKGHYQGDDAEHYIPSRGRAQIRG